MDKLKDAIKGIKFFNENTVIERGRLAYRMGIELTGFIGDSKQNHERDYKLFKIGWEQERNKFMDGQRKEKFRG